MAKKPQRARPQTERMTKRPAKACPFCRDSQRVDWKDVQTLRKFLSDRGKIRARRVTGACVQHQADVANAVKVAREVALLPYVSR